MFKTYSSSSSHNFPLVRDKPPGGAPICETGLLPSERVSNVENISV